MLEADSLKDPLLLHFLFVKRQPFVIRGFLDLRDKARDHERGNSLIPEMASHET